MKGAPLWPTESMVILNVIGLSSLPHVRNYKRGRSRKVYSHPINGFLRIYEYALLHSFLYGN